MQSSFSQASNQFFLSPLQSLTKRKRDFEDRYPNKTRWERSLLRKFETELDLSNEAISAVHILENGGLVVIIENDIHYYPNVFQLAKTAVDSIEHLKPTAVYTTVSVFPSTDIAFIKPIESTRSTTTSPSHELVIGCIDGGLQFWQPTESATTAASTVQVFRMQLENHQDGETVVDLLIEGNNIYLLSSHHHIYFITRRRNGRNGDEDECEGFLFQRSISYWQGLLMTGARLLGVYPSSTSSLGSLSGGGSAHGLEVADSSAAARAADQQQHMIKLLAIPAMNLLITIGSSLTLWKNYQTPKAESFLLEYSLRQEIKGYLLRYDRSAAGSSLVRILDACIMHVDVAGSGGSSAGSDASSRVKVLVLSACMIPSAAKTTEEAAAAVDMVVATLLLHTIEILLPGSLNAENSGSTQAGSSKAGSSTHHKPIVYIVNGMKLTDHGAAADGAGAGGAGGAVIVDDDHDRVYHPRLYPIMADHDDSSHSSSSSCYRMHAVRVYVSWVGIEQLMAEQQPRRKTSLHSVQLDAVAITSARGIAATNSSSYPSMLGADSSSNSSSMQLKTIDVSKLLCLGYVQGIDGVSGLYYATDHHQQQQHAASMMEVIVISPSLTSTITSAMPQQLTVADQATVDDSSSHSSLVGLELKQEISALMDLFTSIIYAAPFGQGQGQHGLQQAQAVSWYEHISHLRNAFTTLPVDSLLKMVSQLSAGILIRQSHSERYWGTSQYRSMTAGSNVAGLSLTASASAGQQQQQSSSSSDLLSFAHRVCQEKYEQHSLLKKMVLEADGLRYPAIQRLLMENHLKACLAMGLAQIIEEKNQVAASVAASGSGSGSLLETLQLLSTSIEAAVIQGSHYTIEEMTSKGMTPYDLFYSELELSITYFVSMIDQIVSKVSAAAANASSLLLISHQQQHPGQVQALLQQQRQQMSLISECLYTVNSMILSAFTYTIHYGGFAVAEEAGSSAAAAAAAVTMQQQYTPWNHVAIRPALVKLLQCLADHLSSSSLPGEHVVPSTWSENKEGKRLQEYIDHLLQSYELEAIQASVLASDRTAGDAVCRMSAAWKAEYNHVKSMTLGIFTSLGYTTTCYKLAIKYHCSTAIFVSYYALTKNLQYQNYAANLAEPALPSLLASPYAASLHSDKVDLGTAYLLWCEAAGYHQHLLSHGRQWCRAGVLDRFLYDQQSAGNGRWHLQMIDSLGSAGSGGTIASSITKRYDQAAFAGLHYAQEQAPSLLLAKNSLSMAKLSAHLYAKTSQPGQQQQGQLQPDLSAIQQAIDLASATISIQEDFEEQAIITIAATDMQPNRYSAQSLVEVGLHYLQEHAQGMMSALTGMGSMQAGVGKDMNQLALVSNRCLILIGKLYNSYLQPAEQQQLSSQSAAVADKNMQQRAYWQRQLEDLWIALLQLDTQIILDLGQSVRLTSVEEGYMKEEMIFYQVLVDALQGQREGTISRELLMPLMQSASLDELLSQRTSLLHPVLVDGEAGGVKLKEHRQLPSNERVRLVVHHCVKLALDSNSKESNVGASNVIMQ